MRHFNWLLGSAFAALLLSHPATAQHFQGDLRFIPPGCESQLWCELKSDFGYVDSHGIGWQTVAGDKTDGASIPNWAQPFIGGQFEKDFIKAAVIHDHYCVRHVRSWRDTHWVFYDALLASGVPKAKALLMYYGVYLGGPKWIELIQGKPCPVGLSCIEQVDVFVQPPETMRSEDNGKVFLQRPAQFGDPLFRAYMEDADRLITERGGEISLTELQARAQSIKPKDFFYEHQDAPAVRMGATR